MNEFLSKVFAKNTPPYLEKPGPFVTSEIVGTVLLVAEAFNKLPANYVIVASNLYVAQKILSTLQTFVPSEKVLFYPNDDLLFTEVLSASKQLEAQRLFTLYKASKKGEHYIYVTNLSGALRPTMNVNYFRELLKEVKIGDNVDYEIFIKTLHDLGYQRTNKVEQTMQYATRGDIVDFFPVNYDNPLRIEFFDNVIEDIRSFNISNQGTAYKLSSFTLLPASESALKEKEKKEFLTLISDNLRQAHIHYTSEEYAKLNNKISDVITDYLSGNSLPISKYLMVYDLFRQSFLTHITSPRLILANEPQLVSSYELISEQTAHYIHESSKKVEMIPHLSLYLPYSELEKYSFVTTKEFSTEKHDIHFGVSPINSGVTKANFKDVIASLKASNNHIYLAINNTTQQQQIEMLLKEEKEEYDFVGNKQITISVEYFPEGFILPEQKIAVLTSKELFNVSRNEKRYNSRFKAGSIIRSHDQLVSGDYVVHEYHGVGQFEEITTLEKDKHKIDYIKIQYAGTDILYIPLEQIHLIRKYSGREGVVPKLHRLGSQEWKKTKKRLNEKINDIADELIALEAVRLQKPGFAFGEDDEFQSEFELGFPFDLTSDQQTALKEIKEEMEKPFVMDRLLCGDVGFGKTEIALRAAYKAISSGKQVLFLCPTTLLARQHYEVAVDRFAGFGVRIGVLSRLVSKQKRDATIADLKAGKLHLLIGTHGLLNVELSDTNVGFLIVDEEQRFGVSQKEKIKNMKQKIDVLTLSATPIPRTLQMALVGIRGLSQINTAPQERMPIQSYVIKKDDLVVKELIERELQRGGQVFYLHNRVMSIYHAANKISKLVKDAKIGVVHGQMERNDIEDVMTSFYNGEINVLVATSIIENGIDVPNANVIIVENADHFGLSQLYQIKGRVGRGNRIAYAYLLYNPVKVMNDTAKKRLKAIQEFTDLGSGYKIAERDLMIRGAGDILGAEQSGFIDTVGIDMYLKMLQDAINNKKYNLDSEKYEQSINIFGVEAYIPDSFASKEDKFDLYLEIKQTRTLTELDNTKARIEDIYGKLPRPIVTLFVKRQLELLVNSKSNFVDTVEDEIDYLDITPGTKFLNIPGSIVLLSNEIGNTFTNLRFVTQNGKIKLRIIKEGDWFEIYKILIHKIVGIVKESKEKNESR